MTAEKHVLLIQSPPILFDELIGEILSRLPVKSLLRFRCVCKSWKSLISNPQFVKLHLQRSCAKNGNFEHLRLLYVWLSNDVYEPYASSCSMSSLLDNPSSVIAEQDYGCSLKDHMYWLIGPCNGLFCLLGIQALKPYNILKEFWVRLWNPATRSISKKSPSFWTEKSLYSSIGFGYDHLSDVYKIVAVTGNANEYRQVKVYNMGSNCWRKIPCFPVVLDQRLEDGVYVAGSLNWIADTIMVIVSLDLGEETYTRLSLPNELPCLEPTLGVLRDFLCVSHDYRRTHFVLWQMKEFGDDNSWTMLMKISYVSLQTSSRFPLCMSENDDVLMLSTSDVDGESQAILYKLRDNGVERVVILGKICLYDTKVYVESLVSPD